MLRRLRRRSLAALRQELEPVPPAALAAFLPQWQHLGTHSLRGIDGLVRAVEQLQGAPVPASALEKLVLPSRVAGYAPPMLDELTATGRGRVGRARARCPARTAGSPSTLPTPPRCCCRRRTPWS